TLRTDAFVVQAYGDATERQPLCPQSPHPGNNLLLAGILHQSTAPAEVPTVRCVSADALAARALHAHRAARPLPDHRAFQAGENAGHLSHRTPVRAGHVETLPDGYELDALLVELGNDVGRIGDGAKEPIELRHDHNGVALLGCGEKLTAR